MNYNVRTQEYQRLVDPITRTGPKDAKFLVAIPHSGTIIPREAFSALDPQNDVLSWDLDQLTDQLYQPLDSMGALVKTDIHRCVVDPNRKRTDSGKTGVIKGVGSDQKTLLKRPYTAEEREALLILYHDPFSKLVRKEMEALRKNYGKAFLLNGHSMYKKAPLTRNGKEKESRPAFCVGTRNGSSAEKEIIETFMEAIRDYGGSEAMLKPHEPAFMLDYPFEGNEGLTAEYGKPGEGMNSLLLEVNQGLYWDETDQTAKKEMVGVLQKLILKTMQETVPFLT